MGLAERRAALEFETKVLPGFQSSIHELAGHDVPVEVNWATISPVGESHLFVECWSQVYFQPLVEALKIVGRDALGKTALKDGLKHIVIQNTKDHYYGEGWATFENGTLTLDHHPITNAGDGEARTRALVDTLEAGL